MSTKSATTASGLFSFVWVMVLRMRLPALSLSIFPSLNFLITFASRALSCVSNLLDVPISSMFMSSRILVMVGLKCLMLLSFFLFWALVFLDLFRPCLGPFPTIFSVLCDSFYHRMTLCWL